MRKKPSSVPVLPEPAQTDEMADWTEVRRQIRQSVVDAAGEMVKAAIEKGKAGHYLIIKYLFQLAGLYPDQVEDKAGDDFSLARLLCDRLGLPAAPEALEAEILDQSEDSTGRGNGHALE